MTMQLALVLTWLNAACLLRLLLQPFFEFVQLQIDTPYDTSRSSAVHEMQICVMSINMTLDC